MGYRLALAAALAVMIFLVRPVSAAPEFRVSTEQGAPPSPSPSLREGPALSFPRLPGANEGIPFEGPVPAQDGTADRSVRSGAGAGAAEALPPPSRAEILDGLLSRLGKATDAGEAQGIAGRVQRLWMDSGSATADLLMGRAVTALNGNRHDVAAALLDKIIDLRPGWAEAWNKRATLRFLEGDDSAAMEDISHVLTLEPRHFGALSGLGFILERHGEEAGALKALRRALAVYPGDADLRKAVDKLTPTVEGQDL